MLVSVKFGQLLTTVLTAGEWAERALMTSNTASAAKKSNPGPRTVSRDERDCCVCLQKADRQADHPGEKVRLL